MFGAGYYPAPVTDVAREVVWTVVVGGGEGARFGAPKQYEALGAGRVIDLAVAVATAASDGVVDVVPIGCVHDAARPLASEALFAAAVAAVHAGADAAVPAVAVADTIKVVDGSGSVVATPDRSTLVAVQTPQAFRAHVLRQAHESGADSTDDAVLVERLGGRVATVPGEPWNRKVTELDDLEWARRWLATRVST
jgi:2-C-methyl-D-erythritol 4-phosphate cytidylyltransferase